MDQAELEKMMREAKRRMNEMHAKAHPQSSEVESKPESGAPHEESQNPPAQSPAQSAGGADGGILKTLLRDKDKTIILALMFLLYSEGGDYSLLLALLYLLMD